MEVCPTCGKKKIMKVPADVSGAGEDLWRCPQHHYFTLGHDEVPEPGTDAWRDSRRPSDAAPTKKAPAKKKAAKKA